MMAAVYLELTLEINLKCQVHLTWNLLQASSINEIQENVLEEINNNIVLVIV